MLEFFLNSGNLICRSTGISMYFRESLGVQDNERQLYTVFILLKPGGGGGGGGVAVYKKDGGCSLEPNL